MECAAQKTRDIKKALKTIAIATPKNEILVIHQADRIFQIKVARKTCPKKEIPGNAALNFTNQLSSNRSGTKATNSNHPGKPNHGKLSKTPDNKANNSRCIRFKTFIFWEDSNYTKELVPFTTNHFKSSALRNMYLLSFSLSARKQNRFYQQLNHPTKLDLQ